MALTESVDEIVENSNNPLLGKHDSWKRVRLGEIADIQNGFAFKSSKFTKQEGVPLIRIRDVVKDDTTTFYTGEFEPEYMVQPGDLLIGMDGDFNCARWRGSPGLLNQRVCRITLKSDVLHPRLLDYALPGYLKAIHEKTSSVTVKHLSSKTISEIPLPVPPPEQQELMAAEIEKQFSRLDEAVAGLKRVKANLKRYKAAVLKAAVEGKLTEEWRKQNPDVEPGSKLLERISEARNVWLEQKISDGSGEAKRLATKIKKHTFDAPEDISLPDSWVWTSLLTASLVVVDCHNKTAPYEETGIPLVRTTNVRDGSLILETAKYVSDETYEYWSRRCPPESGDILFTREAPMGEAAIIPDGVTLCMGQRMMLIRLPGELVDNTFILDWIMSPVFQERFGAGAVGIGVKHLRVGDVERLFVPLPPIEEQRQITEIVDRELSIVAGQMADINRALAQTNQLRQAVLISGFSGSLGS